MNTQVYPLFSHPVIVWGEKYLFSEKELNYIKSLPLSSNGFNESSQDIYILKQPILAALNKFIMRGINHYAYDILKIKKNSVNFYITQSWATFTKPGQSHHPHIHQNSLFSGVFYFQGEKTPIRFHRGESVFPLHFSYESRAFYSADSCAINVEINKLFLFPSSLRHEVVPNTSSTPRISLSFNTFASGEFSQGYYGQNLILPENVGYTRDAQ